MVVGMFCMLGWTTGNVWTLPTFDKDTPSNYPTKDTTIAKNSKFELIWKAEDATVDLIELATGNRWGVTAPQQATVGASPRVTPTRPPPTSSVFPLSSPVKSPHLLWSIMLICRPT